MVLALTDALVVVAVMTLIGLLGYLMDRQADLAEHEEATRAPDPDLRADSKAPTSPGSELLHGRLRR